MKEYIESLTPEERIERLFPTLRTSQTSIELRMQKLLDELNIRYETQKPIGRYIVDIYIPGFNLIVECDGDYWHSLPERKKHDQKRNAWLRSQGYKIIRLWEHEIKKDAQEAFFNALKEVNIFDLIRGKERYHNVG
jgi:very-short-patch-repair endonuclease